MVALGGQTLSGLFIDFPWNLDGLGHGALGQHEGDHPQIFLCARIDRIPRMVPATSPTWVGIFAPVFGWIPNFPLF
jgi:hypothetical protein